MIDVTVGAAAAPEFPMIERINWRLLPGQYWAIAGLPGSGKSGLLATAAGLIPPLAGSWRLFGREISQLSESELLEERRRVGLVFEESGRLFAHLTIAENVALPLRYHQNLNARESAEQVRPILQLTSLSEQASSTPGRLGRTWRQRIGLARALALKPALLLIDNPLSLLDPRQSRWWIDFLRQLWLGHPYFDRKPIALAITCEDLRPWLKEANQFALIKGKQWLPLGGLEQLQASTEPFLHEFLSEPPSSQ